VAVVTGLLLVVVLGAVGIVTHGRLDGATADLAATQARLTGAEAQLHVAQNELSAVRGQSATAGQALAKATSQLASAQSQLAKAQTDVSSQGVSISDLDTCLAGVEKALNQIALQDQAGAAVTLQGVAGNCRAAEPAST
jgi:chromosome segregation ATPase